MDYEKKYKELVAKIKNAHLYAQTDSTKNVLEGILPELAESEDERILEIIKHCIESRYLHTSTIKGISQKQCFAWLEKQGEKKPAWGEEDENTIKVLMNIIRKSEVIDSIIYTDSLKEKLYDWLKSLKERYTWKPSKGQLECLGYAIDKAEKEYSPLANNRIYLTLKALKEELEKLKGE